MPVSDTTPQLPPIQSASPTTSVQKNDEQSPVSAMSQPTTDSLKDPSPIDDPRPVPFPPQEWTKTTEHDATPDNQTSIPHDEEASALEPTSSATQGWPKLEGKISIHLSVSGSDKYS